MIEVKDIEKLAKLSRIKLTDKEKSDMLGEIEAILGYVDQIKAVSGESAPRGKDTKTTVRGVVRNVMREDDKPHESGVHTDAILAVAPARQGNYLKVKKIL